jgi:hypothetical protein
MARGQSVVLRATNGLCEKSACIMRADTAALILRTMSRAGPKA